MFPSHCEGETLRQAGPEGKRLRQRDRGKESTRRNKSSHSGKTGNESCPPSQGHHRKGCKKERCDGMRWFKGKVNLANTKFTYCIQIPHIQAAHDPNLGIFTTEGQTPTFIYLYFCIYIYLSVYLHVYYSSLCSHS